jgi:putative ABC transport system permease protein
VFASGAGAFGPMYLHGADQVSLNSTLAAATKPDAGLTLVERSGHGLPRAIEKTLPRLPAPTSGRPWFGKPIVTQLAAFITSTPTGTQSGGSSVARTTFTFITHPGHKIFSGTLISRTHICAHLHLIAGTCSLGRGEVLISTRTAKALQLGVGQFLAMGFIGSNRAAGTTVVGIYRPGTTRANYWWDQNFFLFGSFNAASAYEHLDAAFASPSTIDKLVPVPKIYPVLQVPFVERSLRVTDVPRFEGALANFQKARLRQGISVGTKMFTILGRAASLEGTVTDIVGVVDLELALLAVLVLYFLSARTAVEREPDSNLAELRGFRPRSALAVALAEPFVIVLAALPIGFFAAWLAGALLSPTVFGHGVTVAPAPAAIAAAGVAGAAGLLAAGFGARRNLLPDVSRIEGAGVFAAGSRWSTLVDALVVAAAAAAFFELVVVGDSSTRPHPLAALAPALLAVAGGVLVARALPWLLAPLQRGSAYSARVPLAMASRLVARRREFAGQLVVITAAASLATFAACGWAVASTNRDLHAAFGVGAPTVLYVTVPQGTTFLAAVHRADPSGKGAMAAVVERSRTGTTLAVDARRMASVVTWPRGLGISLRQVARRLLPSGLAPHVMVRGTAVRVTVDALRPPSPAPDLTLDLFDRSTQTPEQVTFGALVAGTHTYSGSLAYLCPSGCRLVDLGVTWSSPVAVARTGASSTVSLQVRAIAERVGGGRWTPVRAGLEDVSRWTSTTGGVSLRATSSGLVGLFHLSPGGTTVTLAPRDVPRALPVIVTPSSAGFSSGDGGPLVAGLDAATIPGRTFGEVTALPGVGTDAVLSDLGTAELFLSGPLTRDVPEVWLSSHPPAGIFRRLHAQGIKVTATQTTAEAIGALSHDGISLAYLLYLIAAIASGALVIGATAFAMVAAARRRAHELAAVRALGVQARALRRALSLEQAIVMGLGLLTGMGAGVGAAAVALRSVPEFSGAGAGLPLDLGLPPVVVVVTGVVLLVAFGSAVFWNARAVVRRTAPEQLAAGDG